MLWVNKIKEGAKSIFKIHPVSLVSFLLACILNGIYRQWWYDSSAAEFSYILLFYITPALVLCEACYAYQKQQGRINSLREFKKSFVYGIILLFSVILSAIFALLIVMEPLSDSGSAIVWIVRFFWVFQAFCIMGSVLFMYKRNGGSFESYSARAFVGGLKALLVYGIFLGGSMFIVFVFDKLLFDLNIEYLVVMLVTGLVAFPGGILAISLPEENISKFSKVVLSYVFPGIGACAFVIVYAYIIKILVTFTFPSNQVFSITSVLFCSGIVFWTMAQGCTEGKVNTALRFMPLLFIPFIVVQCMCLAMRVNQYGITEQRYLGILLIAFEIIYEIYYLIRFRSQKGVGGLLMLLVIMFSAVYFLIPGINVNAAITNSQKGRVDDYIQKVRAGEEPSEDEYLSARSSYREIRYHGGFEGSLFIEGLNELYSEEEVSRILHTDNQKSSSGSTVDYIYISNTRDKVDISGYSKYANICDATGYSEYSAYYTAELWNSQEDEEPILTVDLTDLITRMAVLKKKHQTDRVLSELLEEPIVTDSGLLYIEYISFHLREEDNFIRDLSVRGFYIYN